MAPTESNIPSYGIYSDDIGSLVYSEVVENNFKAGCFVLDGPEPFIAATRVNAARGACDEVDDACNFLFWTGVPIKTNYFGRCVHQCDFLKISHLFGWECGWCDDSDPY